MKMKHGTYEVYFDHHDPKLIGAFTVSPSDVQIDDDPEGLLSKILTNGPLTPQVVNRIRQLDASAHYMLVQIA